jgi:hypothetical protein
MNSVGAADSSSSLQSDENDPSSSAAGLAGKESDEAIVNETPYEMMGPPDPIAERIDWSEIRGATSKPPLHPENPGRLSHPIAEERGGGGYDSETDLENLAELVPDIKARQRQQFQVEKDKVLDDNEDEVEVINNINPPGGIPEDPFFNRQEHVQYEQDSEGPASDGALHEDNDDDDSDRPNIGTTKGLKDHAMTGSAQSISTATQTHEVRMPMYLPTFKPATGCTNASDFIVRCFVARLRSGITVVKHGRSRWCKSRLRVLHIHPDGRSLSWKPADGEPPTSKRPPKLDLSTCLEVRHAWSPDPQNPMYTGTPILRQKCEAANAHKSFALIFKQRTVDITAVTADQCKVLMEGFSALCFRLQVANLAGRGNSNDPNKKHHRPMPEEDGVSLTASATLTNTSTPKGTAR